MNTETTNMDEMNPLDNAVAIESMTVSADEAEDGLVK